MEKTIGFESSGVAILTLSSVGEDDEGIYACVARNDAGIQEERVQVTVEDNDIDSEPVRGDISGKSLYLIIFFSLLLFENTTNFHGSRAFIWEFINFLNLF